MATEETMNIEVFVTRDLPMEPQVFLAAQALLNGQAVIFPTETVYGIGVDAIDDAAIDHLISIKRRPDNKPFPVMVRDLAMAESLVDLGAAREIAKDYWPGPLTLVLPAKTQLADACIQNGTIGIRCPNHPVAQAILNIAQIPLAVPSCNPSGQQPATNAVEVRRMFMGADIAYRILQADPTEGTPTTVLKIEPTKWTVLRQGRISAETLRSYLPQGVDLSA